MNPSDLAEMLNQNQRMKPLKDSGYCYCDMCGLTAKLPAEYRAQVEDQCECPDCKSGFLVVVDEFPEHVVEQEPLPVWPITYKKPSPCPTCGNKSERLDYHGIGKRCPRCQTLS